MAPPPRQNIPARAPNTSHSEAVQPVTVYELFRRHIQLLSALPGEKSQFDESDFGYEWRCECSIGDTRQLQFSLIDLERQQRPAAVLYLLHDDQGQNSGNRQLLPLEDLPDTHEQLNKQLTRSRATIDAFEKVNAFIATLAQVKESLGSDVTWA